MKHSYTIKGQQDEFGVVLELPCFYVVLLLFLQPEMLTFDLSHFSAPYRIKNTRDGFQ